MSCNESKTVLRVEIPQLRGKSVSEVYAYFKPIIGDADEVDEWDGVIEYFHYGEMNHDFIPVFELTYGRSNDDKVGVDFILSYESDYGKQRGSTNHSIRKLKELSEMIADKFSVNADSVRLLSYTWYNGGDEPIYFGDSDE